MLTFRALRIFFDSGISTWTCQVLGLPTCNSVANGKMHHLKSKLMRSGGVKNAVSGAQHIEV